MKMIKKLILLLLITSTIITVFSCGNSNTPDKTDADDLTADNPQEKTAASVEDIYPYPKHDFGGADINFLACQNNMAGQDFEDIRVEEITGEVLNDAVYQRTSTVEEKYNVTVNVTYNPDPTAATVKNVRAGDDSYQIIQDKLQYVLNTLATQGYLYNLAVVDAINLNAPWYNQNAIKDLAINKKTTAISGDMTVNDKIGVTLTFFNKKIAEDNGLENLYNTVRNGKWTLDKMHELMRKTSRDLDGDGVMSLDNDLWGLMAEPFTGWTLLLGSGNRLASLDSNGLPIITANQPKLISDYEKIMDIMYDNQNHIWANSLTPYTVNFMENRNFMQINAMSMLVQLRPMADDFGIIPLPKQSEDQKDYYTSNSLYLARFIAVPNTCSKVEMTGAVIDALARESQDTIVPAYYDNLLENKIARDNDSVEMLKMIFNSIIYDIGACYNWGNLWFMHQQFIMEERRDYVSFFESQSGKIYAEMEKTINEMLKND